MIGSGKAGKSKETASFKQRHNLQQRRKMYEQQVKKTPEMIAVILEKDLRSKIEPLEKVKFLANGKYTLYHFTQTAKKLFGSRIKKSQSLCFYIAGKVIESGEKLMEDIYKNHRDEDGFLYVTYGTLEAF